MLGNYCMVFPGYGSMVIWVMWLRPLIWISQWGSCAGVSQIRIIQWEGTETLAAHFPYSHFTRRMYRCIFNTFLTRFLLLLRKSGWWYTDTFCDFFTVLAVAHTPWYRPTLLHCYSGWQTSRGQIIQHPAQYWLVIQQLSRCVACVECIVSRSINK